MDRKSERHEDHDGWVVDRKSGRVVRRSEMSLATRVKEALFDAMADGALTLDPEAADPRAVGPADPPAEVADPLPVRPKRPVEAHVSPDARALNREHRGF